jgi:hypothetical protein
LDRATLAWLRRALTATTDITLTRARLTDTMGRAGFPVECSSAPDRGTAVGAVTVGAAVGATEAMVEAIMVDAASSADGAMRAVRRAASMAPLAAGSTGVAASTVEAEASTAAVVVTAVADTGKPF